PCCKGFTSACIRKHRALAIPGACTWDFPAGRPRSSKASSLAIVGLSCRRAPKFCFAPTPQGCGKSLSEKPVGMWRCGKSSYTFSMRYVLLALAFLGLFAVAGTAGADGDEAIILIAHPQFRDLEYRQTVLIAAPAPNGGHVGVILNRPTRRSLGSLFPEHEPSKKVVDPVYYGGPFSRGALVALVKADRAPGAGSVLVMRNLYMT